MLLKIKFPPHQISDYDKDVDLVTSAKERWKRFRTIMNPTFTSTKVKTLVPLMEMCCGRLMEEMDKIVDKEINISEYN